MKNSVLQFIKKSAVAISMVVISSSAYADCSIGGDGYVMDWDNVPWTPGALSSNVTVSRSGELPGSPNYNPVTIDILVGGNTENSLPGYPDVGSIFTGGFGTTQSTLALFANHSTSTQFQTVTFTFSEPVDQVSFPITDIDYSAPSGGVGGYLDFIVVVGAETAAGTNNVLPTVFTPYHAPPTSTQSPSSVYLGAPLSQNEAAGIMAAGSTTNIGNATFIFDVPVEKVTVGYGNNYISTSDPAQQAISLYDLTFCTERDAKLDATKNVKVLSEDGSDCATHPLSGVAGAEAAIPGACVLYTITVTNVGSGDATNIVLSDTLDPGLTYVSAAQSGFTAGPGFSFTEPFASQDCDASSCLVQISGAELAPTETGTITIRTLIK